MLCLKDPESVLIVSGTDRALEFITKHLDSALYSPMDSAKSGNEARRRLLSQDYDLVIINAPLPDEFGHELAIKTAESAAKGVIMLVPGDHYYEITDRVEAYGVATLSKPVSSQLFYQALRLMTALNNRMSAIRKENTKLHTKMNEVRIINRAKCCLIEYLKMTEPQAHRYIEKQAMDLRQTKREIAESILKTYEP